MILVLFISILSIWYLIYRWQNRAMFKLAKELHCDSVGVSLPIIGQSYLYWCSPEGRMNVTRKIGRMASEKGGVLAIWQGTNLHIFVSDAEILDFVTKTCLEKDDLWEYLTIFFGNGSVFSPVKIWRPRRKATAPVFHQKNLKNFASVFSQQSEILADRLREVADKDSFTLWSYITAYGLDSVCESTFGVSLNSQAGKNHPFATALQDITEKVTELLYQPYLHNKNIFKLYCQMKGTLKHASVIREFVDKVIKEKRQELVQSLSTVTDEHTKTDSDTLMPRKKVTTFMELFMQDTEAEKKLTELELREEALVLVLAASDTSAVGVAFTIMLLARHPEIQAKAYKEIQEVIGTTYRSVTPEDLPRLKYLEAVIKESMRLYPPAPILLRKVSEDVTLPTGVKLLKGCTILVDVEAAHRNPKYWGDDIDSFKPERFINTTLSHPAAYIPFSYGPRNCLGYKYAMMSMTTVISTLLQQYRFLPADHKTGVETAPHDEATDPLRVYHDMTLKEINTFPIKLESRHKKSA